MIDINEKPWIVLEIFRELDKLLKVGGYFIWTLKLPTMNGDGQPAVEYIERVIANFKRDFQDYDHIQVKWLLANRNERMFVAVKQSGTLLLPLLLLLLQRCIYLSIYPS